MVDQPVMINPDRIDPQRGEAPAIVRLEPVGRVAHDIEIEVVHAGLVEDHVRELRQPVLDILDAPMPDDRVAKLVVRLPECRLIDPVALLEHPLAETEGLEHLHGPARDAVSLPELQRTGLLVDDTGLDVGKGRQLCRQRQPGRPAADNQDVNLARRRFGAVHANAARRRDGNVWIAGSKSVEVKLHGSRPHTKPIRSIDCVSPRQDMRAMKFTFFSTTAKPVTWITAGGAAQLQFPPNGADVGARPGPLPVPTTFCFLAACATHQQSSHRRECPREWAL